jgi:ParB-like chromosome segregation protein Spo0J
MANDYQLLPELAADDFGRLKASILERGVEAPVVVDEDGAIIDGRNRALIADSLGIDYPKIVRAGLADYEKRILAVELNLARRQLTEAQKVLIGEKIKPDIRERARQRQIAAQNNDAGRAARSSGQLTGTGETRDEVAETIGLGSGSSYRRGKETLAAARAHAPDLMPYVERGDLDLDDVRKELRHRGIAPTPRAQPTGRTPIPPDGVVQPIHRDYDPVETERQSRVAKFTQLANQTRHTLFALNPDALGEALTPDEREIVVALEREAADWFRRVLVARNPARAAEDGDA